MADERHEPKRKSPSILEQVQQELDRQNANGDKLQGGLSYGYGLGGSTCPSCGYCRHCGRGGHYYPPSPWITYGGSTGTTTTTLQSPLQNGPYSYNSDPRTWTK